MPEIESISTIRRAAIEISPRHPHREIAELLAAAILRMRAAGLQKLTCESRAVGLGFSANQSVNTNPSDTEGVRK